MRVPVRRATVGTAIVVAAIVAPTVPQVSAAEQETPTVTITPNPAYSHGEFDGWGTSLAWFANAAGSYALSDNEDAQKLANDFYDLLFSDDGLDLQTVRYNIGGGNASNVADYLRPGAAIEGWWTRDPHGDLGVYGGVPTSYESREAMLERWNPDDDSNYNFNADASQRWWLSKLAADAQVTNWEFFANSAPYFMTSSGYVSGHWRGSDDDQLLGDGTEENPSLNATDKFAKYIARVTKYLSETYGIEPHTVEPLNEPNDCGDCWATDGSIGRPVARQEGMTVKADQQTRLIRSLRDALDKQGLTVRDGNNGVAAMDASSSQTFTSDFLGLANGGNGYQQNLAVWREALSEINTHGYGDQSRASWIRDLAKSLGKPLKQSEFEGDYSGSGHDPYNFDNAIEFAQKINYQVSHYEPSSWILWQPVEDYYNMEQPLDLGGENSNWGSIYIDFDCRDYSRADGSVVFASQRRVERLYGGVNSAGHVRDDVPACALATNSKFNMLKNYTHFLRAGDRVIATDSPSTTAAVRPSESSLQLVYTNSNTSSVSVKLDLSGFKDISIDAAVRKYVTVQAPADGPTTANTLVHDDAENVAVDVVERSASVEVPPRSVTTFVVTGVSGVSANAPDIVSGRAYQVVGQGSGKPLSTGMAGDRVAIGSSSPSSEQKWTFTQVPAPSARPSDRAYVLSSSQGGILTTGTDGLTTTSSISTEQARNDPAATWILNTTDGKHFSLVNSDAVMALDVTGAATAEGAGVSLYDSNDGQNQAWLLRDLTVLPTPELSVTTPTGVVPALPETITPEYRWGSGSAVDVTWTMPDASVWDSPGTVRMVGTASDEFGTAFSVAASITVGESSSSSPSASPTSNSFIGVDRSEQALGGDGPTGRARLAVTGTVPPVAIATAAGLAVLAGAALVLERRRKTQRW